MKTHTLVQVAGMILLAVAVSLTVLAFVYITQHPQSLPTLVTVR
jgi:hypothetical protein